MKYYKYSMNMTVLNIFSLCLFIPFYVVILLLGYGSYVTLDCLVLYFFWMFLHELLHGIGFRLSSDVNSEKIVYGANLEKGVFYCMCKDKIEKRSIMISLMFPFVFIGIITLIIGFVFNLPVLIILSLFNIAGCAGDLAMFFSFLRMPSFSYIDLDDCVGFVLISENDLGSYKLFGMNLVESGTYSDSLVASDYRKITISKLSWIIFLALIVYLFFSIVV